MNVLVLADTFPNAFDPWRGPYNRRQMECLAESCDVTVVSPVPWPALVRNARLRSLIGKCDDTLGKVKIYHQLFCYVPIINRGGHWRGILCSAEKALKLMPDLKFDCILATFAYPHGLAAKHLSTRLGIPYVIKARGTDLHGLPKTGAVRKLTAEAVRGAAAIVAVSSNLADIAVSLGASRDRVRVLTNGIDAHEFDIVPREEARRHLGMDVSGKVLLFVGSLVPVKGLDVLLKALSLIRADRRPLLVLVGEGPLRKELEKRAKDLGVGGAVKFTGRASRDNVRFFMNAADALVLSSREEGCPNVVLEAMACGTPVAALRVGAVPDLLDESNGVIAQSNDAQGLARSIEAVLSREWDRNRIRARVQNMSWSENARKLAEILNSVAKCDSIGAGKVHA